MSLKLAFRRLVGLVCVLTLAASAADEGLVAAVRAADDERVAATIAGDHARLAAVYIKSPSHAAHRAKVLRPLEAYYPQYDWREFVARPVETGVRRAVANPRDAGNTDWAVLSILEAEGALGVDQIVYYSGLLSKLDVLTSLQRLVAGGRVVRRGPLFAAVS
jgi:hypothetical protein